MLENKPENFEPEEFILSLMEARSLNRTQTMALLRKNIPREKYFQDKIKQAIRIKYPTAFVRKLTLGQYSEGGVPDLMVIIDGHYFGFEVKRPIVNGPSKLQERTIRMIEKAGGSAAVVIWPEDAIAEIERWKREQEGDVS